MQWKIVDAASGVIDEGETEIAPMRGAPALADRARYAEALPARGGARPPERARGAASTTPTPS